jgi:hypothetical protein
VKVFISSLIRNYGEFRDAAARGIQALGHVATRAEDYGASPETPQQVCLAGVRDADAIVLLLFKDYGSRQESGLSATHEEYREARDHTRHPILAFVQDDVEPDEAQRAFIAEVQPWQCGLSTERFKTPDDLQRMVTMRLHQLEMSRAAGSADPLEMLSRAKSFISTQQSASLCLLVASGPAQQVIRPSQLAAPELMQALKQQLFFGDLAILTDKQVIKKDGIDGHALVIEQQDASLLLDEMGTVRIIQPILHKRKAAVAELNVILKEDVHNRIERGLRLTNWILEKIDPVHRLSDIVIIATVTKGGAFGWRTREEHQASPRSINSWSIGSSDKVTVHLLPPDRRRGALTYDVQVMAEDLTELLDRQMR